MEGKRYGYTDIRARESAQGWYVMVGEMAICGFHGPPHLHRRRDRGHPDHMPGIAVDPDLTFNEALQRARALCRAFPREPTFDELRELLR